MGGSEPAGIANRAPGRRTRRSQRWRRTRRLAAVVGAAALAAFARPVAVGAQTALGVPEVRGDQLLFVFDVRPGRLSFVSIANPSLDRVVVEIALYPLALERRLGQQVATIEPRAHLVLDPTTTAGGVAMGQAGLAVVTPIRSADGRPVVPPEPLAGTFTIANTIVGSAFGENAFGRAAVNGRGSRARPASIVDGSTIRYQGLNPGTLIVPTYFDPGDPAPPQDDGNRVILVAFGDRYGDRFDVVPARSSLSARFVRRDGSLLASRDAIVDGIRVATLQELAGGLVLDQGGALFLDRVAREPGNLFGVFTQSLGTYASGQRLPAG